MSDDATTLLDYFKAGAPRLAFTVSTQSFDDYMAELLERRKTDPPPPFKPHAFYNQAGDLIEVWWSDEPSYGQDVGGITVYRAFEGGEVTGCQVHGVKRLEVV